MDKKVIPIFRIFDYKKAMEFYIDWLGFKIDWEDREKDRPAYIQVSRDYITLHLTEHHGDCTPGAKAFINFPELKKYHTALIKKKYKFSNPELEDAPWNATTMEVTDPFGNRLLFNEYKKGKRD